MQTNEFATIQGFLENTNPKDKKVLEAMGLSERQMELFWAGLSAVTEETGLAIPNFNRLAAKLKIANSYITKLNQRGLIEGQKRGEWNLTAKAIKKINGLLTGEAVSDEAPTERAGKRRQTKPVKLARAVAKTTVGQLVKSLESRLAKIDEQMAELSSERAGVQNKLKTIMEILQ